MKFIKYYDNIKIYSVSDNDIYNITTSAAINNFVVINEKLLFLPESVLEVAILHEIGHIKLGHNHINLGNEEYKLIRSLYTQQGKIMPMESEADDYMVCKLGKVRAIKNLNELIDYLSGIYSTESNLIKELKLRVKRIIKIPKIVYMIKSALN